MKKVIYLAIAASFALAACDKDPTYSPNVDEVEPCEDKGTCESTD